MMAKACFLDRDGVINKLIIRPGQKQVAPWSVEQFEYLPMVREAAALLRELGYDIHVTTNQPDVEDGYMTHDELGRIHQMISADLGTSSIRSAMHRDQRDYKPNNGMIEDVLADNPHYDRKKSWMIGDSWRDIVAGNRSGVKTIYVGSVYETDKQYLHITPDCIVGSLYDAANLLRTMVRY